MDITPSVEKKSFTCPNCGVLSQQEWFNVQLVSAVVNSILHDAHYTYRPRLKSYQQDDFDKFVEHIRQTNDKRLPGFVPRGFSLATCQSCRKCSLWADGVLVAPRLTHVPKANQDMGQNIQALYAEAASVLTESPRGAAALLRLALQHLLVQLGKPGKNINNDIKDLVAGGLSPRIQQALDVLRVVGNNAVHPGQIDMDDSRDVAAKLFQVLNFIAEEMITKPRELNELYSTVMPEEAKQYINKRDGREDDQVPVA